ncbi:unnamed protein product [Calicophoron daubneyi]|uniref:SS18 N-terminal domain-containing protein n=1 Tax=Calicophoron daubneyi TaxID=300641 RepID=A0AAV2TR98_CALDB
MSAVFAPNVGRHFYNPKSVSIQRLMDENDHIIQLIADLSKKAYFEEAAKMQVILQRNICHLVSLADQQRLDEAVASMRSQNDGPK